MTARPASSSKGIAVTKSTTNRPANNALDLDRRLHLAARIHTPARLAQRCAGAVGGYRTTGEADRLRALYDRTMRALADAFASESTARAAEFRGRLNRALAARGDAPVEF